MTMKNCEVEIHICPTYHKTVSGVLSLPNSLSLTLVYLFSWMIVGCNQ